VAVADRKSQRQRFAALVELEDQMVGEAVEALRRAGRLEDTLIIAVADHGEGLAGDAVRQHDNNFFDESLRVPLIIAGPGMPAARVDRLVSLLDVAPIVLGAVGVPTILPDNELRFGRAPDQTRSYAPFACWHDATCEGYISKDVKVVRMLSDGRDFAFDRKLGASERDIRAPTDQEEAMLLRVSLQHEITRLSFLRGLKAGAIELPSGFACGRGGAVCVHPSRPEGGFHRPIDDFAGH
jgi:membrane-anchored protein YejM (alkaline phosphatase superfamily)